MTSAHDSAIAVELETVVPHLRLSETAAENALAVICGEPVHTAQARLRFGPGRTCEPLARVFDRAIMRAEAAGVDPGSLIVIEATAQAEDDIVRVRRNGYGNADWIHTPACSVRIVLGATGMPSLGSAPSNHLHPDPGEPLSTPSTGAAASSADEREAMVREALWEVIDPDLGVNVVDLGFVRAIVIEGRTAVIAMTLTSAACPLTVIIERQVRDALAGVPGVEGSRIDWQWIPAWRPAEITLSGREQLRSIGFTI